MVLMSATLRLITTNAHLSDARLAQMTGLSRVYVWKLRKRFGLPKPKEKYRDLKTPPLIIQFIERNIHLKGRELSEKTGLYINTIYKIKRKLKLNKNENHR
jgi:predicted DNA-binding transcriptional regulator AlpA